MSSERMAKVGRLAWLPSSKVTKWVFAGGWIVVLLVAGGFAGKLSGAQQNDAVAWLPPDAESTQVLHRTQPFFDQNEIPTVVVYTRDSGIQPSDVEAVADQVKQINEIKYLERKLVPSVVSATDQSGSIIPSEDGKALLVTAPINGGSGGWETLGTAVDQIKEIADDGPEGLTPRITGPGGYAAENAEAFEGIDGKLLYTAAAVVIVILLLTYRSPILWMLPVFSAAVALTVAQGVIYGCVQWFGLTVNGQSYGILTVLVFGAGTDYALLLVARYREELRRHEDRHEAMAFALHRAGPAIFASGSTVIAGMLCLLLATMASTQGLGPVAAIGIVVALAVMLTLLPALLVIFGRWVFWPRRPVFGAPDPTDTTFWARVGARIAKAPRRTWIVTSVVLLALCGGLATLDATGLKNSEQFYGKPEPVLGEEALDQHFPAGAGSPLDVVANAAQADAVAKAAQGVAGVAAVAPPVVKGDTAYLAVTLQQAPDTGAAQDTMRDVRTAVHGVSGADAQVGGSTAINADILDASDRDTRVLIPIILLVVFLILVFLLRALVAPLILIATVVLSFGAALGLCALLFKYVFGFAGADPGLPLFVFVFLVALGIDYNIFLMTRVHEEAKEVGTKRGALIGLSATGGVITSAGLVLAGTFAALGTLPVVSFAEIGIAVAIGVLLDTIVVRAVLVTALNLDVGRVMWWPSSLWLKRAGELIG
ncbi:MAG: MMPL family transporter [Nocardioidaceae bacterium]